MRLQVPISRFSLARRMGDRYANFLRFGSFERSQGNNDYRNGSSNCKGVHRNLLLTCNVFMSYAVQGRVHRKMDCGAGAARSAIHFSGSFHFNCVTLVLRIIAEIAKSVNVLYRISTINIDNTKRLSLSSFEWLYKELRSSRENWGCLGGLRPPKHPQPPTNCVSPIYIKKHPGVCQFRSNSRVP